MKHVALIPARAGSKSIPNKNLVRIGKKRMIDWALDFAKGVPFFDRIYLSTDIETLFDEDLGVRLIRRIPELGTDECEMAPVVLEAMKHMDLGDDDYLWLLQPTSPFRSRQDADEILQLLDMMRPNSLISVKDVGPNHPNRTYTIKNRCMWPLRFTSFKNKQALPGVYLRNGCFYVVKSGAFKNAKSFYIKSCVPHIMPADRSINIDDQLDLLLAQVVCGTLP